MQTSKHRYPLLIHTLDAQCCGRVLQRVKINAPLTFECYVDLSLSAYFVPTPIDNFNSQEFLMTASSHALQREVNDLVTEQIFALKQPVGLDDRDLLEYHLRHLVILSLYRQLDRVGWERASGKA